MVSRRSFIKTAVAAAAAIGFPTIIPSRVLGANAPSKRITVGMIGVGGHGFDVNLPGFLNQADAQVLAVCDVDTRYMRRAKSVVNKHYANEDCTTTTDFREILARPDIDADANPREWKRNRRADGGERKVAEF